MVLVFTCPRVFGSPMFIPLVILFPWYLYFFLTSLFIYSVFLFVSTYLLFFLFRKLQGSCWFSNKHPVLLSLD